MAAPVGSIFELQIRSTVCGQKCLNVLHYVVEVESPTGSIVTETAALAVSASALNSIGDFFLQALPLNCTLDTISAQCIRDTLGTRFARQIVDLEDPGEWGVPTLTANISAVITKRTSFAGRWAVGSFHMPGVPENEQADGLLKAGAYKTALETIALELLDPLSPAGGGTYQPVIYHPDGLHGGYTRLLATELQEQIRVMRRRTVGQGQ